jgi:hypothetical protein
MKNREAGDGKVIRIPARTDMHRFVEEIPAQRAFPFTIHWDIYFNS